MKRFKIHQISKDDLSYEKAQEIIRRAKDKA